ncbi:MAG: hypothetical protein ACP5IC_02600 [Minisyncoccia bacterium]
MDKPDAKIKKPNDSEHKKINIVIIVLGTFFALITDIVALLLDLIALGPVVEWISIFILSFVLWCSGDKEVFSSKRIVTKMLGGTIPLAVTVTFIAEVILYNNKGKLEKLGALSSKSHLT